MKRCLGWILLAAALPVCGEMTETEIRYDALTVARGRGEVQARTTVIQGYGGEELSIRCDYDFSGCPDAKNSFARYELRRELVGLPKSVSIRFHAPAASGKLPLAVWMLDRSGETYISRFFVTGSDAWQTADVKIVPSPAWPSGDRNRKIDLPATLVGIGLEMPEGAKKGAIHFGKITVTADDSMVEFAGAPTLAARFSGGEKPAIRLDAMTPRGRFPLGDYEYSLRVFDAYALKNVVEAAGKITDHAGKLLPSIPVDVPYGHYEADFKIRRAGQEAVGMSGKFSHFMPETLPADPKARAYEYNYSPLGGVFANFPPEMANIFGASWIRFEHPNWKTCETAGGTFDFSAMKKQMKQYSGGNVRPVVLQTLYHYPKFREPIPPEEFSLGYGRYFKRAAKELKGYSRFFELGNEDNGHTKFLYTEVARHGAAAIRSEQPFAILANSGTAFVDHNWLEFQRDRGLLDYLDALCVHPYTNNGAPSQSVSPERNGVLEKLRRLEDIVDSAGGMKQLWSTEYGWPNSSAARGEHDRADLYVREMLVGDAAGLLINGLYTWNRDYNIIGRPAGVAIQTYARMRQGHRFAGLIVDGGVWIAVYERGGVPTAAVWTPDEGEKKYGISGKEYFDIFGNPQTQEQFRITQSPSYIRGLDPAVFRRAVAASVEIAKARFEKNQKAHPVAAFAGVGADPAARRAALVKWAAQSGPVSQREQAVAARFLQLYLAGARFGQPSKVDDRYAARREQLESAVLAAHAANHDLSHVRFLLEEADRIHLEREMASDSAYRSNCAAMLDTILAVAGRFARDGARTQFAVFGNLYMKQGGERKERLVFVAGRRTPMQLRLSSYAAKDAAAEIRMKLPAGWKCVPETQSVTVKPGEPVFIDFEIECAVNPAPHPVIGAEIAVTGASPVVNWFNDIEIVPAVTVEALPVPGTLPGTPLRLIVRNQEAAPVSGSVIVCTPDGNLELARLTLPELKPFGEHHAEIKLKNVTPAVAENWRLTARFILGDRREFNVPFELDFVYASAASPRPAIDSRLDDWKTALPLKIARQEYTLGSYGGNWTPENCSAQSFLMWDHDALYFAAEVTDQTFNQQMTGDSTWQQDSIQIIVAPDATGAMTEFTLALTPKGVQVWGRGKFNRLMPEIPAAIEYRDGKIHYEAAIPWRLLGEEGAQILKQKEFRFAIAVNDDDAIVPRRYLERFPGSVVHGKKRDAFGRVVMGGAPAAVRETGEVFFDDFSGDAAGGKPLKWTYHRSGMPESAIRVVDNPPGKALRLDNPDGTRPNRFAICYAPLNLTPGGDYRLTAQVKNAPEKGRVIGVCADAWGNKSQQYIKIPPSADRQTVSLDFKAPVNGSLNVIVKNTDLLKDFQIDWIKVEKR